MKLLRLLCLFLLPLAAFAADPAFDAWVDGFTADWVRADPNLATRTQYFSGAEQDQLDRQLTLDTPAHRAATVALAQAGLAKLHAFDRTKLDATQRVSAAMLEWHLNDVVEAERYADFRFVFNQFAGLHVQLVNFLSQTHPIRNRRDIENYLARLDQVAARIDDGIALAQDAAQRGFLMPHFITEASLGQFDRFLSQPGAKNVLVASLDERAAKLADLPAADRAALVAQAEKTVTTAIVPAFQRAQALLRAQLPKTTDDAGIWRLPNGAEAYAFFLRRSTTTRLTPDEVHDLGLKEVARIEAQMDALFKKLGYANGSIKDRYEQLRLKLSPPEQPDPREELLAKYTSILRDAEKRCAGMFNLVPAAPIVVKREPAFTEKTAAAHYSQPARDGSRPGIFWAPLPGPVFNIPEMRTLVYHEGVPGHHFQIALQQETTSLPRFRREGVFGFISAHGEGWALYAEHLAAESGWYDGDDVGLIGKLEDELFRARRLVTDTSLHTRHWTRQQAIDYGIPPSEVDRYVVWPGQACSYKIGQLKILELRTRTQQALGAKFSLRDFHDLVLKTGGVPLAVLEQVVDDYIAANK